MPVQLLSDRRGAETGISLFFLKLYQELWWRKHDEATARSKIYSEEVVAFPDYERTSASTAVGDRVPTHTFRPKFLDLSWIEKASTLRTGSRIFVRQDYEEAMRSFEQDDKNVVLSGQQGIGACFRLS